MTTIFSRKEYNNENAYFKEYIGNEIYEKKNFAIFFQKCFIKMKKKKKNLETSFRLIKKLLKLDCTVTHTYYTIHFGVYHAPSI